MGSCPPAHRRSISPLSRRTTRAQTGGTPSSPSTRTLTIAVKDNICTSFLPTTCSSRALSSFHPPYDATCVSLLLTHGAHIIGKTNLDEFGMGSFGVHSVHGPVRNPRDRERVPGGSSSGSAAAVAGGLCDVALGSDTGGSIRLPASYSQVLGLKPSYGLISRYGLISYADSLDTIGLLARDFSALRETFGIIAKEDEKDATCAPAEVRAEMRHRTEERAYGLSELKAGASGLRIGIPAEYFPAELGPCSIQPLRHALSVLHSLGATLVPVSLPATKYALSAYYVLASAEASSNLARYDGVRYGWRAPLEEGERGDTAARYAKTRSAAFGEEVQRRLLLGTYALTADAFDNYYLQAQKVRQMVKHDLDSIFRAPNVLNFPPNVNSSEPSQCIPLRPELDSGVDVILHPTAIGPAPLLEDVREGRGSPLDAYVQDVLSVPASLAGLPALNIPVPVNADVRAEGGEGTEGGVGVSVVGQWGWDEMVLNVGELIYEATRR
ncbi:amidase signature enzyme [Dacryopinax primogenitus]|uniref:Glutamyl-tRNA(Gln) amidotransferase subunit A, mitochondrial n=1 Tax=Dacryopinax primogenitus (strain DJM 731) TaxID=1858805 RepID=M5FNW3_DACPD|nr:amidase signature enzyme [Dacryopinax primogenitus]EJT96598.1 amidase signature enzyme [Dacryopinax primogenitus]